MLSCTVLNDCIYFSDKKNHYYTHEYLKKHNYHFCGTIAEKDTMNEYVEMEKILDTNNLSRRKGAIIHCLKWQLGLYNAESCIAFEDAEYIIE